MRETMQELLGKGVDVNVQDQDGLTVLHIVAKQEDTELARFLMVHGATDNARDRWGRTPSQMTH